MGDAVLSTHDAESCTAVAGLLSGGVAMPGGLLVSIHHVLPHYQVWLQGVEKLSQTCHPKNYKVF